MKMKKFKVNEIVEMFPSEESLQYLQNSHGIIRDDTKIGIYVVYSCYDGELIELSEKEIVSTGNIANPSKFDFHEIVTVVANSYLRAKKGFIGAKGQTEDGIWSYDVFLFDMKEVRGFEENELESTGEFIKEKDFYSGERIKVIVHSDGRGELKKTK